MVNGRGYKDIDRNGCKQVVYGGFIGKINIKESL